MKNTYYKSGRLFVSYVGIICTVHFILFCVIFLSKTKKYNTIYATQCVTIILPKNFFFFLYIINSRYQSLSIIILYTSYVYVFI